MRPGETAGLSTPADLQRRRRKNIFVFSLFLAAVLVGLAATVLAVNNGRNYRRLVRQLNLEHYLLPAPPPPKLRVGRQRHVAPRGLYPPRLLQTTLERADTLQRDTGSVAADGCDNLDSWGHGEATFKTVGDEWECLFYEEFGSSPEPASLFVQARGAEPNSLRTFRIKLSLTDAAQDAAIFKAAIEAVDMYGLSLTPESRSYLAERLPARSKFTSTLETFRMTYNREMTDERRFNLIILPLPATISCNRSASQTGEPLFAQIDQLPVACLPLRAGRA